MEYFLLKVLPIFLVYLITFARLINSQCGDTNSNVPVNSLAKDENYLMVKNIFNSESKINTGDLMNCEVTKTKSIESSSNDNHVFTPSGSNNHAYIFFPAPKDKKCFSYQVRATSFGCVILSPIPSYTESGSHIEVILEYSGKSVIRKGTAHVNTSPIQGIINNKELRGFWIRWLDDQLIEAGRDGDNYPILSYRLPEKLSVNFIGIFSYQTSAEWILHEDPNCGAYNITKKIEAESKCKIGPSELNLQKINNLQKSQEHILNQIKSKHGFFKVNKLRSKEILLVYQKLIEKLYRNAEENQNKIYDENDEIYCPLKSITFNEISKEYLEFMAELKMELASFKQTASDINGVNNFGYCSGCCGCSRSGILDLDN